MFAELSAVHTGPVRRRTASALPVVLSTLCALAAALLVIPAFTVWGLAVVGYLLGAILVPALTIGDRFARRSAARHPFYVPKKRLEKLATLMLLVGALAGATHAWFVATEIAKR